MMVVAPDGYIVYAEGFYITDHGNNDSTILKDMLKKEKNIMSILQPGDAMLVDRGFQTVQSDVEQRNIKFFITALLAKKQSQFTTNQANLSRRVTVCRYIVELTNGRLKNKFRFFDETIPVPYFPVLRSLFLVGCAMLNKFTTTFVRDKDFHEKVAEEIHARLDKPNMLQRRVENTVGIRKD